MNRTFFQFFHWYAAEENLWHFAKDQSQRMSDLGISNVWLPPAFKSARGTHEPGYAAYDLFDLGEFDQRGSVRTKYGTREDYLACIAAFHDKSIGILADIVLNHKVFADEEEAVPVKEVNQENRNETISEEHTIQAYTRFTFPGRQGTYSDYTWDWHSFTGIKVEDKLYIIMNEHTNGTWEDVMEKDLGNYDFLLGCDIEFRNPAVREELKNWGKWYVETTGVSGFRLDAVKHISTNFFPEWLSFLKETFNRDFLAVGEYWQADPEPLLQYIEATQGMIQLFDVPLHFNFYNASREGDAYDLRQIFDNTLIQHKPEFAITFVDNHDTQPLQDLESWVDTWFKPHAYALILLREQGIPCVFFTDLYGAHYEEEKDGQPVAIDLTIVGELEQMLTARKNIAYGLQRDYIDDANLIGWTRSGTAEQPGSGCAVLLTNKDGGEKQMSMGEAHAGKTLFNLFGDPAHELTLNEAGEVNFYVAPGKVAVWVFKQ
jgi:alpha-amylase